MKKAKIKKVIIILCILIVLIVAAIGVLSVMIYNDNFNKRFESYEPLMLYVDDFDGLQRTQYKFPSDKGQMLTGYMYSSGDEQHGIVVMAHGFGGGGHNSYMDCANYFAENGYYVFAYDATGNDESEGEAVGGLPQGVIDLDHAISFVEESGNFPNLPIVLFGHSWGGYAVTAVLNFKHSIAGVVSVSGYNSASEMTRENSKNLLNKAAPLTYLPSEVFQAAAFGRYSSLSAVNGINRARNTAVYIMHGDQDETISYRGASILSHRGEITNPNVIYHTFSEPGQNTHSGVFCSKRAAEYRIQWQKKVEKLKKRYKIIPDEVWKQLCAETDITLYYERNDDLYDSANQFFESRLK